MYVRHVPEDGANCGPLVPTDTRDRQETPPPKQTIPPTIGDNVLQQEDAPPKQTIPPTIGDNVLQQEDAPPKQTIPPTIGDNVLQQEDGVLETQPADEGIVQEPSSNEINQSATVE